jgi:hypothetical protein
MAAFDILTWSTTTDRSKRIPSASNVFDFQSVRIGAANLTIAQASSSAFDFGNKLLSSVTNPVAAQDVATKAYVDAVATGLTPKASVHVATTTVLPNTPTYNNGTAGVGATLTGGNNNPLGALDGHTPVVGERILVKNQAAGLQNGLYTMTQDGDGSTVPYILTRSTDADTCQPASNPKVVSGIHTFIEQGGQAGGGWVLTTLDPITLGSTALVFSQFSSISSYSAGNGINITGPTISARIDGTSLQFSSGIITLTLDGSTLSTSGTGLKVANNGITPTQLNTSVAGNGLTGGGGSALAVLAADTSVVVTSGGVAVNAYSSFTNDNAGTISAGQIVYIKTNGHVDLASNTNASNLFQIGIVKDATIATTASGKITVGEGVQVGGFSSLTPGAPVYVSNTAGAVTQSTAGFTAGQFLYQVGYALTATTIVFEPQFLIEW